MGKSIRSKIKRKNRTEFRNTIGAQAAKEQMDVVQAKLQECINSGTNAFSSIQKLSDQIWNNEMPTDDNEVSATGDEEMKTESTAKKSSFKHVPIRKAYKKKKHAIRALPGSDAARMARRFVAREKRRGRISHGVPVVKERAAKKRAPRKNRIAQAT